jgi:hypothetical protein
MVVVSMLLSVRQSGHHGKRKCDSDNKSNGKKVRKNFFIFGGGVESFLIIYSNALALIILIVPLVFLVYW